MICISYRVGGFILVNFLIKVVSQGVPFDNAVLFFILVLVITVGHSVSHYRSRMIQSENSCQHAQLIINSDNIDLLRPTLDELPTVFGEVFV